MQHPGMSGKTVFHWRLFRDTQGSESARRLVDLQNLSKLTVSGSKLGFIASCEWSRHDTTAAYVGR